MYGLHPLVRRSGDDWRIFYIDKIQYFMLSIYNIGIFYYLTLNSRSIPTTGHFEPSSNPKCKRKIHYINAIVSVYSINSHSQKIRAN